MVHVVNKGKEGEREVCRLLNGVIQDIAGNFDLETQEQLAGVVQRNQNQSAVGGGDINLFGLSIEVKRQETLSVEQWWRQATASAARNQDKPVLIYRQNRKAWHVVMDGYLPLTNMTRMHGARVEVSLDTFLAWFRSWVLQKISEGELSRV